MSDSEQPARIDPPLPAHIGDYDVQKKLGAGGMGTVYLGRHQTSGELAAIKVLSASLAREPGVVQRFQREIEVVGRLKSQHIVALLGSGEDSETGQLYFAMDYVEGQTLTDLLLTEKRLSWEETVDIALQICMGLKSAHVAGVIHRDLKPSNLLIGNDGLVRLTDFGVAQLFATQRLTVTGGIIGTAEYMSPEQAEGRRCTKQSDLYSLGAVIYVMLTGRPPFTGTSAVDVIRKHLTARFDRPSMYASQIPRLLDDIVCQLLEKSPEKRFPDAHIVALRLREVVKRVELSQQAATLVRPPAPYDLMATTSVHRTSAPENSGDTRPTAIGTAVAAGSGPGAATMMRNAIVEELSKAHEKSAIAKLFDNTFVLLFCLTLLIAGGVWWVNHFNLKTDTIGEVAATSEDSEVDRFLLLAAACHRARDYGRELTILQALYTVIRNNNSQTELAATLKRKLAELKVAMNESSNGYQFARQTLERAKALKLSGESEQATALLHSILVLYESDPGADAILQQVHQQLEEP